MRKFYSIVYILFFVGLFSSCLDEDPKYTLNSKVVYESESAAQLALNGIYGTMATQGGFAQLIPEVNTEASGLCWTSYKTSDNRCQYTAGLIPVANEFNDLVWGALYKAITNCNIFINSCNDSESGNWTTKPNMVAQAKFMRAVCYYNLLAFYGGVPLRLEPSTSNNIALPRASRQQVIDQIAKDWTEAAVELSETSSLASGTPTAPSKYSAYAYLTKLYWILGCNAWAAEQGDVWANGELKNAWPEMQSSQSYFTKAKEYGDLVIEKGEFELEASMKTLFGGKRVPFSKEFVFVVDATGSTSENVGYNSLHWTFSPQNCSLGETWGRSQPNKSFYDWAHGTYQDDPRLKITFTSLYEKYENGVPAGEYTSAYPLVSKNVKDTVGWETRDTIIAGRPITIKVPIVEKKFTIIDSIDYRIGGPYADPRNPAIAELDSTLKASFAKTKGPSDWNINDWPYFYKYFTTDCTGRYANNNLYVYRYADFLLLMADVENELGNKGTAISLVNKVLYRARHSGSKVSTYPKDWDNLLTTEQIREKIFHERLFELAAEYDGFTDTRRRGIAWRQKILERNNNHEITKACYEHGVANNYKSDWREYWYPNDGQEDWNTYLIRNQLLPIPQGELSTNDDINIGNQNPGY